MIVPAAETDPETPIEPVVRPSVAEAIAAALAHAGARLAFTVPGESFLPLLDALPAVGIRVVTTRHEGGASFMAEAATQLSGRPQVVLATRTVGAANAAIGIHTARQDSAPLVALIGQVRRSNRGREAFQESDLATGIGSLAKWSAEVGSAERAMRQVSEGLRERVWPPGAHPAFAAGGHPQVAIDPVPRRRRRPPPRPGPRRRPAGAALAGGLGARRHPRRWRRAACARPSAGWPRCRRRSPCPSSPRGGARTCCPTTIPHYLGMTGYWAAPTVRQRLLDADLVLVLGARLSEVARFGYRVPGARTRWAHVDLEPRHARAGLPAPTLSVAADASRFLDAWSDLRGAALDAEVRDRRVARLAADRAAYLEASQVDAGDWDGPGVHPGRVVAAMQRLLPANAIITTDAGNFSGWVARGYRFRRPGTFLGPTSGAMGYGLPAAIAASMLHPDRPVIALAGDGGFAMTMAELETAVREGARPIAIVFDNGHYGTIRMHQERDGRAITASDLGPIDFAAVARSCGALGFTVIDDAGIEPALAEALASGRPAVIHLSVDRRWVSVDQRP